MKALLMTVGTGVAGNRGSLVHGLFKSIRSNNPDLIVYGITAVSRETQQAVQEKVQKEIGKKDYETIQLDEDDINENYKRLQQKIDELKSRGFEVFVDFTSGTKAMSAAAVLAAADKRTDICYITGKRQNGIVIAGEETLQTISLLKPEIDRKKKLLLELFRWNQYEACLSVVRDLKELTGERQWQDAFNKWERIIQCYRSWDLFDHKTAHNVISSIDKVPPSNKEFLGRLTNDEARHRHFLLADLLNNAERRSRAGEYDNAVARLYRAVEFIAQLQLERRHKIDTSNVQLDALPPHLQERYSDLQRDNVIKLSLEQAYGLLKELGDPLGKYHDDRRLRDALKKRNESILAHGIRPVTREECDRLFDITLEIARELIRDIDEIREKARFPKPEELFEEPRQSDSAG